MGVGHNSQRGVGPCRDGDAPMPTLRSRSLARARRSFLLSKPASTMGISTFSMAVMVGRRLKVCGWVGGVMNGHRGVEGGRLG